MVNEIPELTVDIRNTRAHIKDVFTSRSSRRMSENEQGTVLIATLFIESCERRQYNEP